MPASDGKKHVLGLDIGTQSLKAIVAGPMLSVVAVASRPYDFILPQAGWAEQDPSLWEAALAPVIAEALRKARVAPSEVAALAVAGQLDGCVPVGRDGLPLSNALIWMDRRATAQARLVDARSLHRKAGIVADASHMAAKIAWIKQCGPAAARAAHCFHQPTSYLVSRLTGRRVLDHGLASTTMLYSLERRDYDAELLAGFGIAREELPEIAEADSIAGSLNALGAKLTGLPAGVPVAVGTGDDFAAALGSGLTRPGRMVGILGTAEVVGALHDKPALDERFLLETHRFTSNFFFIENPGWLSGGALAWFQELFKLDRIEELDRLAATAPAGADGVLFLPALSGAMAPEWNASARGCFYGLAPSHGVAHLARAVLEGCAFAMRDVLCRLREMGVPVSSILLSGGGANSALWAQIRADVCALPVAVAKHKESSPIGAAMLAAVAGGLQPSVAACAPLAGDAEARFQPHSANAKHYEKVYSRYRQLFESLKPLYAD